MSKWRSLTIFILLALLVIPVSAASQNDGVDNLRGSWDIQWELDSEGNVPLPELNVYVVDIEATENDENVYLGTGCMAIAQEGLYAPLSIIATDNLDGTYDVEILSTVLPGVNDTGPFTIRFEGLFEVFSSAVSDDQIAGILVTNFSGGVWSGEHHDRQSPQCPDSEPTEGSISGTVTEQGVLRLKVSK